MRAATLATAAAYISSPEAANAAPPPPAPPAALQPQAPTAPTKLCDPDRPERCSLAIQAGQFAPYGGHLISTELAIALAQHASACPDRVKLETDYVRREMQLQVDLEHHIRELEQARAAALQERIDNVPWFERPIGLSLILVGGLVGGILVAKRL